MATIYNSDLFKELKDGGKIQQLKDDIPNQLAEKIVPVMEVNPKFFRRCNLIKRGSASNATSATVYTTPTDRDFFLCAACLSVVKDATATSVLSTIRVFPEGAGSATTQDILVVGGISLTAQSEIVSISLPYPIKVERGSNIVITNSTNVGNVLATGSIIGFLVENILS